MALAASTRALPPARTRRLIILAMLAVAACLAAVAVIIEINNPENGGLPAAIQSVSPAAGDEVLSQADIFVDLAAGYTGSLEINGFEIPDEELQRVDGLNLISYRPGPGMTVESLLPDQNCVRLTSWQIAAGPEESQVYSWCFTTA